MGTVPVPDVREPCGNGAELRENAADAVSRPREGTSRMTQARTSTAATARRAALIVSAACCALAALDVADAGTAAPRDIGPGDVVVHTALGGFILGYDIDESGGEGLLSEALTLPGGGHNVAVET